MTVDTAFRRFWLDAEVGFNSWTEVQAAVTQVVASVDPQDLPELKGRLREILEPALETLELELAYGKYAEPFTLPRRMP